MSEKQEFPKALYLHGACRVVGNEEEQAAAEAEGHTDWHADQERVKEAAAATKADGKKKAV
jgi:hypothetical protein